LTAAFHRWNILAANRRIARTRVVPGRADDYTTVSFRIEPKETGGSERMLDSEKDRLATEVAERYSAFEEVLFRDKRRYPPPEFKSFWEAGRRYAEMTKSDALIHRKVVQVVHGLTDMVVVGRKRIPASVAWDAERLEYLVFSRYDPHFEGDEPPGL
jgi:hypothetical protein